MQWSLLLISFVVGAVLDWVRHQPYSFTWDWRMETGAILIAAWISVAVGTRWPGFDYAVTRVTGLLLLATFLGSLALHFLLAHP